MPIYEIKKTVFVETKTNSVLMIKDVKNVKEMNDCFGVTVLFVILKRARATYEIPLCEIKWYSVKTEEFYNIQEEQKEKEVKA